jgi:ABC-type multidrug transport system fused ATPase/permease subunit
VLNEALRSAGLFNVQPDGDEDGKIGLDSEVKAGGNTFSQGQKQIVALARAVVRRSKLLILDEATAAIGAFLMSCSPEDSAEKEIDYETDQVIQNSIRKELKDVTVITIAHRLKSVMDSDKIVRPISSLYLRPNTF